MPPVIYFSGNCWPEPTSGCADVLTDPFFAPFAGNAAAIVVAAARHMLALGIGPEEVLARHAGIVRAARTTMSRPRVPARPARLARCPQCGARLRGMTLNRTRCTRVAGFTTLHWCDRCDFEEYL